MIFNWFNSSEAEKFGLSIAVFFAERVAPNSFGINDKKSARKLNETISKVLVKVELFRKESKLNTFQKAKLAKTVQRELLTRGYDMAVVRDLVNLLVRSL